ncbi:MAG: hypothetical protein SFV15_12265 [Polyangiaceae bacterium]|nr:hypothetical protein [Polyangiaceae bacterium]
MTESIRLIWDFRGRTAEGTARHQSRHLAEFAVREHLATGGTGAEAVTEIHWIAWMLVAPSDVERLRQVLRPHRALPGEPV